MEQQTPRRPVWRAEIGGLAERLARLETTVEHLQETLGRVDRGLGTMQGKIDDLSTTLAQGTGGLRMGMVLGKVAAAVAGFAAAHLWPGGK
jgi:hypothetical protein